MTTNSLFNNQPVIISLDVDDFLYERLDQIINCGFSAVEFNTTDPKILSQIIEQCPSIKVGAGGIINTDELELCYQAGVHFATSPGFLAAIAQTANIYSLNYLPGVATVSEAMAAVQLGIKHVRPFPASLAFCDTLNRYFPDLSLLPADIAWDEAEGFLNIPSVTAVSIHNPSKKHLADIAPGLTSSAES